MITAVRGRVCIKCGKPLISEDEICVPCRGSPDVSQENCGHSYDRLWMLFPYTGKYRRLLSSYKFKKNLPLAEFFVRMITELLNENPLLKDAVIVPVPPRPGKIKKTGWDQVDYLVKRLKKKNPEKTVSRCLKRRKSKMQKQLNRKDRLENLKDRIYVRNSVTRESSSAARRFCGSFKVPQTALVIDDVITTGSTMEICAKVLKEAGANKVYGLCLFYD